MDVNNATSSAGVRSAKRRAELATLYEAHVVEVYRFVHRRCRDRTMAEDVTQDTFLTVLRSVADPADINVGWLIDVARNRLFDIVRRRARYVSKLRLIETNEAGSDISVAVTDQIQVRAAFDRLTVDHRLLLALHYIDDMTLEAIATELGRSHKSVESLLTRARRSLRHELEKDHD